MKAMLRHARHFIPRRQYLKFLRCRWLSLELAAILRLIRLFPRLEHSPLLARWSTSLSDKFGALLEELGF